MTPARYHDRTGEPITVQRWAELWEDLAYRVVCTTQVGEVLVRTCWEGVTCVSSLFVTGVCTPDHGWTTVANADSETEALDDHAAVVGLVGSGGQVPGS